MKYILLSFMLVLFSGILFSQNHDETQTNIVEGKKTGEIVRGKNVAYKIVNIDLYCDLANVAIPDSLQFFDKYGGQLAPEKIRVQIRKIVYKHIKLEDLCVPPYKHDNLIVSFTLDKNLKIRKLKFSLSYDEGDFWVNLPVDRFYEMEKDIRGMKPKLDKEDIKRVKEMDFEHGAYYVALHSYKILYETLMVKKRK